MLSVVSSPHEALPDSELLWSDLLLAADTRLERSSVAQWSVCGYWNVTTCTRNRAPPCSCSVTLSKFLCSSVPQFLHQLNGDNKTNSLIG